MRRVIQSLVIALALFGVINWGFIAAVDKDMIAALLGAGTMAAKFAYLLVSLASLWVILRSNGLVYRYRHRPTKVSHHITHKQNINPLSPAIEEQKNFISEGGNSQPLDKK